MVLQKRLDYGFSGYQVPPTPRATRSARRRGKFPKKVEQNQMCAFDLLAIVAGDLLHEKENPPSSSTASGDKNNCLIVNSTNKNEQQDDEKNFKVEARDELVLQSKEPTNLDLGLASAPVTSKCVERFDADKLANGKSTNEIETFVNKLEIGSSKYKLEGGTSEIANYEFQKLEKVSRGSEDPVAWDKKPAALDSSDSSPKAPLYGTHGSHIRPVNQDDVNVDSRDDDENSSGCTHPSTPKRFFRQAPCIGYRRTRKILASKYWKVAPRLKDSTVSKTDGDWKPHYHKRKNYYKYQRSERLYPFKKRKHYGYSSQSNSEGRIRGEFACSSPQKDSSGATGASSSVAGQQNSFQHRDSHVKLRIKSFKVPELFIEIPESATVGLLKRTVMDALTAILGGGLRVGVLLQGKNVWDDNKTLLQTGISGNNQVDALGFSLEPNSSRNPASLCTGDSPSMLSCDTPKPISRYPPAPSLIDDQAARAASPEPQVANLGNFIESDHDSAPSPTDMSIEKSTTDSKALVPLLDMNVEALAVVPMHRKSKRSEIAQRRIRRPFSVAEVEALVQAVEKLGTGRWRDVKLRAFDNVKHRTYVDLKDKWKTLVHTARISPQQRRGEPVPQELLDRVLMAHAYWSQQQVKQQMKQQETCLLL